MSGYQAFEIPDRSTSGDTFPTNHANKEQVDGNRPPVFILAGGFLGAFALAWLVVVALYFSFNTSPATSLSATSVAANSGPFASTLKITQTGPAARVKHNDALNPSGGDFMLFVWFKSDSPLGSDERSAIVGKYDVRERFPEGYGVALVGGAEGIRPQVYWHNKGTRGRWYVFASTRIEPQQWYLLAVTFRSQRYLGVHIAPLSPGASPEVLGGYDLEGTLIPASDVDLVVGALGTSTFRGEIGPFGVLRNVDIVQDAPRILKKMAREPSLGSDVVDASQIALWANPLVDRGPLNLSILDLARRTPGQAASKP